LVQVLERYLDSRLPLPGRGQTALSPARDCAWPSAAVRCSWEPMVTHQPASPCNTGCCGRFRRRRHPLRPRPRRLVHGLLHTFSTTGQRDVHRLHADAATRARVHVTSQRYVTLRPHETRTAAAQNNLYGLLEQYANRGDSRGASAVTMVGRWIRLVCCA